jgi:pimeloyl-ACP methyl ester carboxylesterase
MARALQSMHAMSIAPQIVVFPGLGEEKASAYTFRDLPYDVTAVNFIPPFRGESFEEYVERMAVTVRMKVDSKRPLVLAGISLGSAVAQEMARHVGADALILISGYRASIEISPIFRFLGRVVAPLLPAWFYRAFIPIAPLVVKVMACLKRRDIRMLTRMFVRFPKSWFKEHCRMAVSWKGRAVRVPMLRIHGTDDPIIPYKGQPVDVLVEGDRHMCNLSQPQLVNRAIERFIGSLLREPAVLHG